MSSVNMLVVGLSVSVLINLILVVFGILLCRYFLSSVIYFEIIHGDKFDIHEFAISYTLDFFSLSKPKAQASFSDQHISLSVVVAIVNY